MAQYTRRYLSSHILSERPRVVSNIEVAPNWRVLSRWAISIGFLLIAVILSLLESSVSTTSELEIARLARERDLIQNQNLQLAAEIADFEKPLRIRERAYALGFVDISKSVKLIVPVAAADPAPAAADRTKRDDRAPAERWFNDLMHWVTQARP